MYAVFGWGRADRNSVCHEEAATGAGEAHVPRGMLYCSAGWVMFSCWNSAAQEGIPPSSWGGDARRRPEENDSNSWLRLELWDERKPWTKDISFERRLKVG